MNTKPYAVKWGEMRAEVVRREFLCAHTPRCPVCDTAQVQLLSNACPAEWRCRHCKHVFDFEPTTIL